MVNAQPHSHHVCLCSVLGKTCQDQRLIILKAVRLKSLHPCPSVKLRERGMGTPEWKESTPLGLDITGRNENCKKCNKHIYSSTGHPYLTATPQDKVLSLPRNPPALSLEKIPCVAARLHIGCAGSSDWALIPNGYVSCNHTHLRNSRCWGTEFLWPPVEVGFWGTWVW